MRNTILLTGLILLGLSGCAQQTGSSEYQLKQEANDAPQPLSKKCEDAKRQLDKTVEGGQQTDLRELKRNIELYCIWRRD